MIYADSYEYADKGPLCRGGFLGLIGNKAEHDLNSYYKIVLNQRYPACTAQKMTALMIVRKVYHS